MVEIGDVVRLDWSNTTFWSERPKRLREIWCCEVKVIEVYEGRLRESKGDARGECLCGKHRSQTWRFTEGDIVGPPW